MTTLEPCGHGTQAATRTRNGGMSRQSGQPAVLQDIRELGRVTERALARHPERPVRERWGRSAALAARRPSRVVERLVGAIAPAFDLNGGHMREHVVASAPSSSCPSSLWLSPQR